ncbi:TetR/AcrR family transcriptional regulator [Anaerolentibacter hominis]|uniref:TetR/AcrR family transcriptional regulator n=1 Tax=Anaerolentibacter hominis TaxID=3079009 RepID=UPI0031B86815
MARNKYPEVTVNRILDVSYRLFMEKGYEHTTIQDIVDALGDLSKGAIYHHFKSKDDIIEAVAERLYLKTNEDMAVMMQRTDLTGLEKLKQLLWLSLKNPGQNKLLTAAPNLMKNPRFLADQVYDSVNGTAVFILPAVEEGIRDGSITTEHPKQLVEVTLLLLNIWMNPLVFICSKEELRDKYDYLDDLFTYLGVPILEEGMLELVETYRRLLLASENKE